jgi:signal transduction histidine kinase
MHASLSNIQIGQHRRDSSRHAVDEFSHEIRNSLGAVRNAMRILALGDEEHPRQRMARLLVERQVEQMTRLVDDLLDVSRIRGGRLHLDRARVDLRDVLKRALETADFKIQQRRHRLAVSMADAAVWIDADASRLEQVFVNLLINAAKYTEPPGRLDVSLETQGDEAVVRIRDSGVGIAPNVLPHIFDPYVQVNESTRKGGLGLGLPLVRSLVESHGGRVTAESAGLGKGSEFRVRLPLALADGNPH